MAHTVYSFDGFLLDASTRVLTLNGVTVSVPPKSFDCLVYLIEQRDRAIGRDELISAVWGRADVSDAVLAQTLRRARIAVDDDGDRQVRIRTVVRFGYQWISPVALLDGPPAADSSTGLISPSPQATVGEAAVLTERRSSRGWLHAMWLLPLTLIGLVFVAYWLLGGKRPVQSVADQNGKPLVAVLPVEIKPPSGDTAWIRLGVMDYMAGRLRVNGQLNVVPSSQVVMLSRGDAGTAEHVPKRVFRDLGARWIVSVQVVRDKDQWQVHVATIGKPHLDAIDTSAATVLEAAAMASDELEEAMIGGSGRKRDAVAYSPLIERVQRIDAAMLDGKLEQASALIAAAPHEQSMDSGLRVRAGQLAFRQGKIDAASTIYSSLLKGKASLPVDVQAACYMGLGAVAVRQADFSAAQKNYDVALELLGSGGDADLIGQAYMGLGVAFAARGEYDRADNALGRARIFMNRAGNALAAASVDVNLGLMSSRRHRYSQALVHFDRAISIFRRDQVQDNLAAALLGKLRAQLALLDMDGARAASADAWQLVSRLDNPILVSHLGVARATVLYEVGALEAARKVLSSFAPVDEDRNPVVLLRARVELAVGDATSTVTLLQPVVTATSGAPIDALPVWAAAAVAAGRASLAQPAVARIDTASLTDPVARTSVALARAIVSANDKPKVADQALQEAVGIAHDSGIPALVARADTARAWWLVDHGQIDQASALVGDLAPYAERIFAVAQVTAALYRKLGETQLAESAEAQTRKLAGERDPERRALF
ncbi:MAG TPA: winged helix-turn-helix domain-containing protein [Rhodanobacteraceae bacterium]|nr:winged helix-turn-helix domain-containing protein [Rhodanobacteraceae bacterium]